MEKKKGLVVTARTNYLKYGDSDARWFHYHDSMRPKNHINGMLDETNVLCNESEEIDQIMCNYFAGLFSTTSNLDMLEVLDCVEPRVTDAMNDILCRLYSIEEVKIALKSIHPHKGPTPNGMNTFFYQRHWDIVGPDIPTVLAIFNGNTIPPNMNYTFVTLISKKQKPYSIIDSRPISLSNIVSQPAFSSDDTITFFVVHIRIKPELLDKHEKAFVQQINYSKAIVSFNKGISWIPRLQEIIMHMLDDLTNLKVHDWIDFRCGTWRDSMIKEMILPHDAFLYVYLGQLTD
ncbi:hypothetical protein Cgig2_018529 [Carnegiea gigantea]|uniref:Uncharacterized protein n=1 Tax=Carnegiea gigantea TaxID=171969 RepID=A0A9Q1JK80_9CARY|nr:hypothetical protein Cgig2_018529 [Carnegiea gigantea]